MSSNVNFKMENESDHLNENGKRTRELAIENPDQQKRVKFNVGGHRYEISHTILMTHPETMLARSASDLWHKNPDQEIFLNGDGERFRYVLDYLRDGEIYLPFTIPKAALVKDLKYFGFQNVDKNRINLQDCNADLAAATLKKEKQLKLAIRKLDRSIAKMQRERVYRILAHNCFRFFCCHGTVAGIHIDADKDTIAEYLSKALSKKAFQETEFNTALARYGFHYVNHSVSPGTEALSISLGRR